MLFTKLLIQWNVSFFRKCCLIRFMILLIKYDDKDDDLYKNIQMNILFWLECMPNINLYSKQWLDINNFIRNISMKWYILNVESMKKI
jgi:hypothetical protein